MADTRIITDPATGEELEITVERSTFFNDPMVTAKDVNGNEGHGTANKGDEAEAERRAIQEMKKDRFGKADNPQAAANPRPT